MSRSLLSVSQEAISSPYKAHKHHEQVTSTHYVSRSVHSVSISIYLLHNYHNAPVQHPIMHHFVTEVSTCVHISATKWGIVGYLSNALWNLWDVSIAPISLMVTSLCIGVPKVAARKPWKIWLYPINPRKYYDKTITESATEPYSYSLWHAVACTHNETRDNDIQNKTYLAQRWKHVNITHMNWQFFISASHCICRLYWTTLKMMGLNGQK